MRLAWPNARVPSRPLLVVADKVTNAESLLHEFGLRERLQSLGFDPNGQFVVALSGGPDSLALLVLAIEADLDVEALVVDHAMRDGSAEEAKNVREQARLIGAPAQVLTADKSLRSMADARAERYRLLEQVAERRPVLVAHHCGDPAETVALRLEKGSGWRGLALHQS